MANKSFNITEILESVDNIVSNKNPIKKKVIETRKQFVNKKTDILLNQDVEKIIIDAEKEQDDKQFKKPLILNNPKDEEIFDIEENTPPSKLEPLVLLNEFKKEGIESDEDNNFEKLENNHLHEIKKLKNSKLQLDEEIKDLNILLDKFRKQERYSDLDKTIKLYQEDNAILRKKILRLEEIETLLRLQLIDINEDKNIRRK